MKRLVCHIVSVDEDVAEKAFDNAVKGIVATGLIRISPKSTLVEPHDDYRGIVARFDFTFTSKDAEDNKNASKTLYAAFKTLLESQLWHVNNVRVLIQAGVSVS